MKHLKKLLSILVVVSMVVSLTIAASATVSSFTVTTYVNGVEVEDGATIKASDVVTLAAEFDTLSNAKAANLIITYPNDSFAADASNNTEYNFGTSKKPVYYPNYILDDFLSNKLDEMHTTCLWDSFVYSANEGQPISLIFYSSENYVIEEADEAEDMYPENAIGVNLAAIDSIADGSYEFTVTAVVSDATAGDITLTDTVTLKVGEDAPIVPDVPEDVVLDEETFDEGASEITVEEGATIKYGDKEVVAGANAKVYTFFAKASKALAAEAYGVTATIGEKTYKFPGAADVSETQNWAIRFVVPTGTFADGVAVDGIAAEAYYVD